MSSKPKVLVTHCEVPSKGLDLLQEKCDLIICPELPYPSRNEILKNIPGVDAVFWISKEKMDDDMMNVAGPGLKVVATMSAGYDNIDLTSARSRGIKVGNTPNVLNAAVAEIAIALLLETGRRLPEGQACISRGRWEIVRPQWMLGKDLQGSTVGIVGLGGIGLAIARRLKPFDVASILYCGHKRKPEGDNLGAVFVQFEALLKQSDFVIISCPLNEETKELFNDAAFNLMKPSAILVNIGRGGIVDQPALVRALQEGKIWGAGLDVMTPEPLPIDDPLLQLHNCVLVPHLGSATEKTRNAMAVLTARNILAALEGSTMPAPL